MVVVGEESEREKKGWERRGGSQGEGKAITSGPSHK